MTLEDRDWTLLMLKAEDETRLVEVHNALRRRVRELEQRCEELRGNKRPEILDEKLAQ